MKYFYRVYTEYSDNSISTYGYFKSFALAYAASAEYNDECGNTYADNETVWEEVNRFGSSSIGCHTIERIEFDD